MPAYFPRKLKFDIAYVSAAMCITLEDSAASLFRDSRVMMKDYMMKDYR